MAEQSGSYQLGQNVGQSIDPIMVALAQLLSSPLRIPYNVAAGATGLPDLNFNQVYNNMQQPIPISDAGSLRRGAEAETQRRALTPPILPTPVQQTAPMNGQPNLPLANTPEVPAMTPPQLGPNQEFLSAQGVPVISENEANYLKSNRITLPPGMVDKVTGKNYIDLSMVNPNVRPRSETEQKVNPPAIVDQGMVEGNQKLVDAYKNLGMSEGNARSATFEPPMSPATNTPAKAMEPLDVNTFNQKMFDGEALIQRNVPPERQAAARAYMVSKMAQRMPPGMDPSVLQAYAGGGMGGLHTLTQNKHQMELEVMKEDHQDETKDRQRVHELALAEQKANAQLKTALERDQADTLLRGKIKAWEQAAKDGDAERGNALFPGTMKGRWWRPKDKVIGSPFDQAGNMGGGVIGSTPATVSDIAKRIGSNVLGKK